MTCTPGGEARVLLPFPLQFSLLVFQLFSSYHLSFSLSTFFFSPSLPLSLLFFPLPRFLLFLFPPRAGKGEGFAKLLDHLGRQRSRRARSVAFSRNLPIGPRTHGSFICILRFFEVKLTRRLPLPTTASSRLAVLVSLLRPERGPSSSRADRLLGRSLRHGPPTQKTVAVLAKYREAWKLMQDRLSADRSIDRSNAMETVSN